MVEGRSIWILAETGSPSSMPSQKGNKLSSTSDSESIRAMATSSLTWSGTGNGAFPRLFCVITEVNLEMGLMCWWAYNNAEERQNDLLLKKPKPFLHILVLSKWVYNQIRFRWKKTRKGFSPLGTRIQANRGGHAKFQSRGVNSDGNFCTTFPSLSLERNWITRMNEI